jgi:anaphase-promoting complex subunit 10
MNGMWGAWATGMEVSCPRNCDCATASGILCPRPLPMASLLSAEACPSSLREIGHEAVWSLSTAKPGNGVEQLRDSNPDTYWQSDGGQPHRINIQFHKKMSVSEIWFYLDYKLDESYTPKKISIQSGTTFHDLQGVHVLEIGEDPSGWVKVNLGDVVCTNRHDGMAQAGGINVLRTHFLQVVVLMMHQNGRDTHIRQVKVFGPRVSTSRSLEELVPMSDFRTLEFTQFSCIR